MQLVLPSVIDCRDASNGPVLFSLTVLDCLQGIYKVCSLQFHSGIVIESIYFSP